MDLGLNGKIAFVAGASRGLGAATARQLAREGARVAINARQLGQEGIRFNSILPASTDTERMTELNRDRARRAGTTVDEEVRKQAAASPFGRMATPQEFASVATFLCSPAVAYVTGVMLTVDGGMYKGTL